MVQIPSKYQLNIPGINPDDVIRPTPTSKWGQLRCHWTQKTSKGLKDNQFLAVINFKSKKIYIDDEKPILAGKITGLILGTPILYMIAKTAYHILFPLSLAHQIYRTVEDAKAPFDDTLGERKKVEHVETKDLALRIIKVIAKNFLDIIRTPLYSLAMTIVAIATMILAPFNTDLLYEGRALYGDLLVSSNWGEKENVIFPICMMPLADLSDKGKHEKKRYYVKADTVYNGPKGSVIYGVNNLTASLFRRSKD